MSRPVRHVDPPLAENIFVEGAGVSACTQEPSSGHPQSQSGQQACEIDRDAVIR